MKGDQWADLSSESHAERSASSAPTQTNAPFTGSPTTQALFLPLIIMQVLDLRIAPALQRSNPPQYSTICVEFSSSHHPRIIIPHSEGRWSVSEWVVRRVARRRRAGKKYGIEHVRFRMLLSTSGAHHMQPGYRARRPLPAYFTSRPRLSETKEHCHWWYQNEICVRRVTKMRNFSQLMDAG